MPAAAQPIDRQALVARHDVRLDAVDPHAPVMLGNGDLGFTADITGLQTFPEAYAPQSPLLTMAQWAWHNHPNPAGWTLADGETDVPVPGRGRQPYAWFDDFTLLETRPALRWLRENPHRFSLARIALQLRHADGRPATLAELADTDQRLDLWRGVLVSRFRFDGQPVVVETRVAAGEDTVLVDVRSPLIASGRLAVTVGYPGVGRSINPDPSDWSNPQAHRTEVVGTMPGAVLLRRTIDDTVIHAAIRTMDGSVAQTGAHAFRIDGQGERLAAAIGFGRAPFLPAPNADAADAADEGWRDYWRSGGMIDFAGSTDARAAELERRVVLSQYLARVNQAGALPPQEEGLFSNSWNGKFHGEMVPWHAAHWASWGRPEHLRRMMGWYREHLPQALARARQHGLTGAWWPKMTGPEGRESPSPINPFIMWQQPHPIFLAELLRRADPSSVATHAELVEETARLLASWPHAAADGSRTLGPPIVPVQENHDPLTTRDPAFELEYYRWALQVAQDWRVRAGLPRDAEWDQVIAGLPAPEQADGLYLPVAGATDFWPATLGRCRGDATGEGCLNRDHPSFLMAYGYIPGAAIDPAAMRRTLAATEAGWDLRQLWGWDYPMVAMTAARLGDAAGAVDWLFADQANNRWGRTGMTPRNELHAGEPGGADGQEYRRIADTYFPSNGALLLAVGMMAAGWDGATGPAPGFPQEGWTVRSEGILPLP
ncbi:hypothetical protein PK98_01875 [Croceibacterium mercuriale]|uniref:Glycoside hydrolase family 65 n=2 Tax=Croceibacterium mercuriale TaxID=1572751 RepID=A0A0B2C327_9SPHN|nr:hypothetical protein PK98_01875 [Croceibacterium mercuriale]